MAKRKIIDPKQNGEKVWLKGHAQAIYMSDGSTVEDAINSIQTDIGGGIVSETDPIFSASPAASITEEKKTEWDNKVDKVSGKGLSTEDFTSALKTKLEGLSNYDDTELSNALSTLRGDFDKLVSGDTTTAIKTFNEIIAFLDGIQDSQDLSSIIASIEQQIAGKMDKVTLATVATSGSYNDLSNKPTIPAEQVNADWNATSGKAQILNKPTIPSAVTESTVSGWGFTKNTGTYSKPSGGIPKSDLDSATQQVLTTAFGDHQTIEDMSIDISDLKDEMSNTVVTQQYGEDKIAKDIDGFITRRQTVYALPDSVSENSSEDDVIVTANTLKTINGQSIVGSGDIEISGGSGGSSSDGRKEVIYWDALSGDTITGMRPNVVYWVLDNDNITIESFEEAAPEVESYDLFTAILMLGVGDSKISLTLPDYVSWANGTIPELDNSTTYELSISRISDGYGWNQYNAVLTPFKAVE